MKPEVARRRIEAFERRFGKTHLIFACHAAFPLALTPDLLYKLWANFQRDIHGFVLGIPWVAVADLLLSSLCDEVGRELYEMDTAVRNSLLNRLKDDENFGQQRINELSDFLLVYVQQPLQNNDREVRDFAQVQRWTALAYVKPSEVAQELKATLDQAYQQDRTEQVRLASLVETFAEPLAQFESLLAYAREIGKLTPSDSVGAVSGAPDTSNSNAASLATTQSSAIGSQTSVIPVEFSGGTFKVEEVPGQESFVGIDFLADGGLYQGELAIFNLEGMDKFAPGSPEFIKEAARRALSNSHEGYVVISDDIEGARLPSPKPEGDFNSGEYRGVKTFAMKPGAEFGFMLVPNGTVRFVLDNPGFGGDKQPLFSMVTASDGDAFCLGQIADVTGDGSTFVIEDLGAVNLYTLLCEKHEEDCGRSKVNILLRVGCR
jgi:hypothetical protein